MAKAGFLPLYVELYDKSSPEMRPQIERFNEEIKQKLSESGLEIIPADICRLESEFLNAVSLFEKNGADCIITLHLAYSPSLESVKALTGTSLPLLVLDTTPDYEFCYKTDSAAISYNHGIHGVQDMCNVLKRNGKKYKLFTGHYLYSDVIAEISAAARAIGAANRLKRGVKIGKVGKTFEGMGDFLVSDESFASLGISTVKLSEEKLCRLKDGVTEAELKAEFEKDRLIPGTEEIGFETYKKTEAVGLAVRKWLEEEKLDGFSMNFQSAGEMKGFDTMPFSEASKAMARGTAYAGEGDLLTAGLLSAFIPFFKDTGFIEMFCPDWKGGGIFLSHMGECNLNFMDAQHMIIKDFPYASAFNPTCIMGHMRAGMVCIVNIAPNENHSFTMTFAEGNMLPLPEDIGSFNDSISGWFKPQTDIRTFLKKYSENGATHHSVMIYGAGAESLSCFAEAMGLEYKII